MRKRYGKKSWRGKKRRARRISVKKIRRIAKREIYKLTDVKSAHLEAPILPQATCWRQAGIWRTIDPPMDVGAETNYIRWQNQTINNLWGNSITPDKYASAPAAGAPFLLGTNIKRIGFRISMSWVGLWYTGQNPTYTAYTGNTIPIGNNSMPPNQRFADVRISLVRAPKNLQDGVFEAEILPQYSNQTGFRDPYDRSCIVPIYDKIITLNAVDGNRRNLTIKMRGKKGSQRLKYARSPSTGALLYNWLDDGNIYLFIRYNALYSFVDNNVTYTYIPIAEYCNITTYYVDI